MIPADVAVASEASSAVGHRWQHRGSAGIVLADVRVAAAGILGATVAAGGLLIASRRLSGGITGGLSAGGMAAVMICMLTCVAACDWFLQPAAGFTGGTAPRPARRQTLLTWAAVLPRLGLWTGAWGLCGGSTGGVALLIAVSGAVVASLPLALWRGPQQTARHWLPARWLTRFRSTATPPPTPATLLPLAGVATASTDTRQADASGFLQQQTRRRTTSGGELVTGSAVVSFAVGDRVAYAHVGFCPPFTETPSVQLSTAYDELDAVVTPGEVLPWGIRIECRLEEAAEDPFEIPVDFVATASSPVS